MTSKENALSLLEEKIMEEINFFTDKEISLEIKEDRLKVSEMINKLANTYIQAENIIERKKLNEVKFKENDRLIKKYSNEK